MGSTGENFSANLLVLNGKNWDRWRVQMKVILGYQEVTEIVEEGYPTITEGSKKHRKPFTEKTRRKIVKLQF